jgi:hypothetical protein
MLLFVTKVFSFSQIYCIFRTKALLGLTLAGKRAVWCRSATQLTKGAWRVTRLEVLAVRKKIQVFWYIARCRLLFSYRRFGGACCLSKTFWLWRWRLDHWWLRTKLRIAVFQKKLIVVNVTRIQEHYWPLAGSRLPNYAEPPTSPLRDFIRR